jgi:DnaJ-class molecular chaperone
MPCTDAALQKAKDLHPDLKASFSAADGEAFLRLVAAYEVLNDPQQRQLYDITSNSRLPGPLKRAAAAAAAAAAADGSGSSSTEDGAGSDAGEVLDIWQQLQAGHVAAGPKVTTCSCIGCRFGAALHCINVFALGL